ncbi:MAG: tRNA pseudouridine(55) synthase TruB [Flavobacteriales bacterium Tduv]
MTLSELQEGKILLVDKPLTWTSFDVVNKIRWNIRNSFDIKKIKVGHAGTLDPQATGLLIVCTGKATRKINLIQRQEKVYTGIIKLGAVTPSYDTETDESELFPTDHITGETVREVSQQFLGEINQSPPLFSALRKEGKRLYEWARKGIEVEVTPRRVRIEEFKINEIEMPYVNFSARCGKGTYLRSLAYDFGKALRSGGYLTSLRRERIGNFSVENAYPSLLKNNYLLQE